jgi:hypothetical protein
MAQTAVDLMDEYLGMKDGPERNFSQTLQDRRDESIGATESDLVDRLFKSVQDSFQNGQTISDADRDKLKEGADPQVILPNLSDADRDKLMQLYGRRPQGRTISDQDLAIGRTMSDQDQPMTKVIRDEIEQGGYGLSEGRTFSDNDWWAVLQGADPAALLSEKGATISDRDRDIIRELTGRSPQPTEVITESPEGAAALDETMQLPPAMELAQMGLGYSSGLNKPTPELWEGLGTMLDAAKAEGGQLSNYEQMLLLASLGIPGAALGGRAVGGLMSKLGVGSKLRGPKLGRGPSAMRDMGPQAGNITAGAIALQKLGRPIPGRIKSSFDKILGEGAVPKKGLASLGRPIPPRLNEKAIEKILKEYQKRR